MKLWKKLTSAVQKYGTDFELVCKNNVNKGTANVTVKGIGKYAGSSVRKTYQIKKTAHNKTAPADLSKDLRVLPSGLLRQFDSAGDDP